MAKIEEETIGNEWIKQEVQQIEENKTERLPTLKFEELKVVDFVVDFGQRFEEWIDHDDGKVKKIIPVIHNGERKNLWLNTKNPLYVQMLKKYLLTNNNRFKVIQVGNQKDTKYNLIE